MKVTGLLVVSLKCRNLEFRDFGLTWVVHDESQKHSRGITSRYIFTKEKTDAVILCWSVVCFYN